MSHHPCTDYIGDKAKPVTVPRKQGRARTATAVQLRQHQALSRRYINLILRNAGWPKKAKNIGFVCSTKSCNDILRVGYLPLLPQAVCKNLNLGSECALVIGKPFQ